MKRENLVALIYADNECCTDVVTLEEVDQRKVYDAEDKKYWYWSKLIIDLKNETWQQEGKHEPMKIGCGSGHGYGLIGIYDKTNIQHLNNMIFDAMDATGHNDCGIDAD